MQVIITVNSDNIIRITDGKGAFACFGIRGTSAQLLSVYVPEGERKKGVGSALLQAGEKLLSLRKVTLLYADFPEDMEGLSELFSKAGFIKDTEADIFSVSVGTIVYSPKVKKVLYSGKYDSLYIPISDFDLGMLDNALKFIEKNAAPVSCYGFTHFNRQLSGVVLDDKNEIVAAVLCSDIGRSLNIDALIGKPSKNPEYLYAALVGMADALKSNFDESNYIRVTMAAYNNSLLQVLEKSLSDEPGIEVIGKAVTMSKKISNKSARSDVEYLAERDDFMENAWERELGRYPLAKNIVWKAQWMRK